MGGVSGGGELNTLNVGSHQNKEKTIDKAGKLYTSTQFGESRQRKNVNMWGAGKLGKNREDV